MNVRTLVILSLVAAWAAPAGAGQLLCRFGSSRDADVNDFGDRKASGAAVLSPEGAGCPVRPAGRALDTGQPGGEVRGVEIPVSPKTSFSQGTVEAWVNTRWDWTDRGHHTFVSLKMEGEVWSSLSLYHHGTIGAEGALAFNLYDGVDNCVTVPVSQLRWKQGEWHHIAASWTERTEWLFADGKLIARRVLDRPMKVKPPSGPLRIGGPGLWGAAAAALLSEVRVSDLPLYVGLQSLPGFRSPLPDALPAPLLAAPAARIQASSTAPPVDLDDDVPAIHNGKYGDAANLGGADGTWARADLPQPMRVAGVRWSRDGRPLKGPDDWAEAKGIPRDYRVDVSPDGREWQAVLTKKDHYYEDGRIPREGMVFEHRFPPVQARSVRLFITRGQAEGPGVSLDELAVLDDQGRAIAPTRVVTAATHLRREYAPAKLCDGRLGEESCWRAAAPGEATLLVSLGQAQEVKSLVWSRSAEGLAGDGTPAELVVDALIDGRWSEVGRVTGNKDPGRHTLVLQPVNAAEFRIRILATVDGKEPVLDEIRFG